MWHSKPRDPEPECFENLGSDPHRYKNTDPHSATLVIAKAFKLDCVTKGKVCKTLVFLCLTLDMNETVVLQYFGC
jgi:hypothetical protein